MSDLTTFDKSIDLQFADVEEYLTAWNYLYITGAPFEFNRADMRLSSNQLNSVDVERLTAFGDILIEFPVINKND